MREKLTPQEQDRLKELIIKIFQAVPNDEPLLATALAFCLMGAVKKTYNLAEREAVEFCAEHIKSYAQFVYS